MNQIKNSFVKKKTCGPENRKIWLRCPDDTKSVLLVTNEESKPLKKLVADLFASASVYHLFLRPIKEDRTVGFYYAVHKSDFNLTGGLKNDKLINLEKMQLDLLLDLSSDSELLDFFVGRSQAEMKIGDIHSYKAEYYDLLLEFEGSDNSKLEKIHHQLNKLTAHAFAEV